MQLKGRLVIVPFWLKETIVQYGLPMTSLLNLNELSEHFSKDDIISYHGVNKLFCHLNMESDSDLDQDRLLCYSKIMKHIDLVQESKSSVDASMLDSAAKNKFLNDIESEGLVFLKSNSVNPIDNFNDVVSSPAYLGGTPRDTHHYVVNLFHIDDQNFGLTLKLYDGVQTDVELVALDNNIQLLFTHYKYEEVCKTQIFHRWCYRLKSIQQQN